MKGYTKCFSCRKKVDPIEDFCYVCGKPVCPSCPISFDHSAQGMHARAPKSRKELKLMGTVR